MFLRGGIVGLFESGVSREGEWSGGVIVGIELVVLGLGGFCGWV